MQNKWDVLMYPHLTEKSIGLVEENNTLVFIVDPDANKKDVKSAAEDAFDITVADVNTLNDTKNRKKAFIKLSEDDDALDIATRLGMI